jgi:23S rRNA pseudouridine2605 synthase
MFLMPEGVKISKFIAECGVGSRRYCETLVETGRIKVNGRVMDNVAERVDPFSDVVKFAGRRLQVAEKAVYALNKPAGHVSTMSDTHAKKTIADLIPSKLAHLGLAPVGRLDKESEGLMILTNEGELANRLMHPRYRIKKVYRISLDKAPPQRVLNMLKKGVTLPDGDRLKGLEVNVLGKGKEPTKELELTLREGKKREIRRAFEMFGYDVRKLKRISIGPIRLGVIRKGELVKLSANQVRKLKIACGLESP